MTPPIIEESEPYPPTYENVLSPWPFYHDMATGKESIFSITLKSGERIEIFTTGEVKGVPLEDIVSIKNYIGVVAHIQTRTVEVACR